MKTINDVVVARLNKYLGEKEMSQYKLSQLSGVPYETIKGIMQKKSKGINLKTLIMICHGLDIKPCEFLDDDNFLAENLELI